MRLSSELRTSLLQLQIPTKTRTQKKMLSDYFFMHTQLCLLENYNHFWCYFDRCNQTLERAYANSGSELKKVH